MISLLKNFTKCWWRQKARASLPFLLLFFLPACEYQDLKPIRDQVLVYCSEGNPETFNPQLSTSGVTFDASSRTLYNRLVEFKPNSNEIAPSLAESWSISPDGKEYTFHLRENVSFHQTEHFRPTRYFNADDVIFSFSKQSDNSHPFHNTSQLSYRYYESMGLQNLIESIEKSGQHTVIFKLSRPESPFLATLTMDFTSILSAEYADSLLIQNKRENIDSLPVGTGPYQLTRYQPDAFIRYKAHANYWNGEQQLKNLVFAITPDPSLRFARVIAGECDLMTNPLPIHLMTTKKYPQIKVTTQPGLNTAFLSLNTQKPPFDNPQVRKAIELAINKPSIIKVVYQNNASLANSIIPPTSWAHVNSLSASQFDPQKSRQLLEGAGYASGFELDLWIMSAQRAYNPNAIKMAELIQQNLKAVGISVNIHSFEYATFLNKIRNGEHQAALAGWIGDNGDPDNFFTPLISCSATKSGTNSTFWCDNEIDQHIQQAKLEKRQATRYKIYEKLQQKLRQESPLVPIAHATRFVVLSHKVQNFNMLSTGGVSFEGVYLEQGSNDD